MAIKNKGDIIEALKVSANQGELKGFMFLYRGLAQAIRNHYAHNDPATNPAPLEWLGFISALFYKLNDAAPIPMRQCLGKVWRLASN